MIKTNELEGDLALGRHANIGGDLRAQGSGHIKLNLRVDGYITANKIKVADKGLFSSSERLLAAYPHPEPGDWALVAIEGSSSEHLGQLYLVNEGKWQAQVDSSGAAVMAGAPTVESELYEAKLAELQESVEKKVEKVQGKQLSTNDYTDLDKAAVEKIATIQETANRAYNTAWSNFNEYYGTINVGNERGDGSMAIIYGATTEKAGLMTAEDKKQIDAMPRQRTVSKTMALNKNKLLCLATKSTEKPTITRFRLSILHQNFLHSVEFDVAFSNARYLVYETGTVGNLPFVERIIVAVYNGTYRVIVRPSENLTNTSALPTIRLDIQGDGWYPSSEALTYLPSTSIVLLDYTPKFETHSQIVEVVRKLKPANPIIDIYPEQAGPDTLNVVAKFLNGDTLNASLPNASEYTAGVMTAKDKRKIDSFDLSLQSLIQTLNQLAERVEALEN